MMLKDTKLIEEWLLKYAIFNFTINSDFTVDINDNINLMNYNLKEIPIQFNTVRGNFYITGNDLETCNGFPKVVYGHVNALNCNLISLEGCPQYIYGDLNVNFNHLTLLKNAPIYIDGTFLCKGNPILNFQDFNCEFTGHFYHCTDSIDIKNIQPIQCFENFYNSRVLKITKKEIDAILLSQALDKELNTK